MCETKDQRRKNAEHADRYFEPAVQHRGAVGAIDDAAEQPRAEAEAAHVGGDDGSDGLDGRAERLVENPDPEQLVDQPGGA